MIRFVFIVLLLLPLVPANPADEVFRRFSTDDGLSENTVQVIFQDHLGFMWFGTEYGLNKFDGYRFKPYHFNTADTSSFNDNIIRAVMEDSRRRLWVGTAAGGLYLYNRLDDSFQRFRHQPLCHQSIESVYCMAEGLDGKIWIGSQNGLECFDPESGSFELYDHWHQLTESFDLVTINALIHQATDTLWIGTNNQGLWRLLLESGKCDVFQFDPASHNTISHNRISDVVMDRQRRLWVATYGGGLNLFDQGRWYSFSNGASSGLNDNNLFKVFLDDEGKIYIGSERDGLFIADLNTFQPLQPQFTHIVQDKNNPKGLASNNIRAVYQDRLGNLWIGFFKAGLNLGAAKRKRFEYFAGEMNNPNSLSNNLINEIIEDTYGRIWIGTDGGGLNLFDPLSKKFTVYRHDPHNAGALIHDHVLSIIEIEGKMWIGTWGGLTFFDPQTGRFTGYAHPQTKDPSLNNIFKLFTDAQKMIWICTYDGLEIIDPRTKQFKLISSPLHSPLTSNWVLTGMQDKNGNIWIGTREGLNKLCKSDWESGQYHFFHYLHRNYDSHNPRAKIVQTVFESSTGELFAGTLDGLYRYAAERDTFDLVLTQEGNSIKGIFRILEDDQECLWISTMNGLTKLEPSGRTTQFDKSDGLQSDEFAFGACRSSSGQLYFGGVNGFNRFKPSEIIQDERPPKVVLTDFLLFNRSSPLRTVIDSKDNSFDDYPLFTIRPNQNVFSFEFAALDYANPAKCRYAYRMEGVDADWIFTDSGLRVAAYRNLAGGKYKFHVRAANGDGIWNNDGLHLNIRVIPPFWKSNWALMIYLVSAAMILLLLRAVIIAKTHYDAELRMDQMKLNFFTHVSHEFRTPLTLILGPVSKILQAEETLPENKRLFYKAIISRSAKRLHHLIGQVMDLQKLEQGGPELQRKWSNANKLVHSIIESFSYLAESRQISLQIHCEEPEIWAMIDRDKVEKITYNLISNALDYTPAHKSVNVFVAHHKSMAEYGRRKGMPKRHPLLNGEKRELVEISVIDTGVGISAKHLPYIFNRFYRGDQDSSYGRTGTGVGLALSKQLAELHGGMLFVDSEVGKGSCFSLLLPIGDHEEKEYIMNVPDEPYALDLPMSVQLPAQLSVKIDKPHILVIEDDLDMRLYIVDEISTEYAVISIANGREGIGMAIENIPDLIICDVMMPEMSGFDVCRTLKADQRTSHIPIILLTARIEEEAQLQGLQMGADDYIKKPFEPVLLRARIDNLLQTRKRLQEQFSQQILLQPAQVAVTSTEAQFLLKLMDIIEKHLGDEFFNVDALARKIGLSRSQMYRKVQAVTGQTPQELIAGMRLQRAAQLLLAEQLTVSEIAYQVGFSDPAHFSKSFKKRFGCPPSSYHG